MTKDLKQLREERLRAYKKLRHHLFKSEGCTPELMRMMDKIAPENADYTPDKDLPAGLKKCRDIIDRLDKLDNCNTTNRPALRGFKQCYAIINNSYTGITIEQPCVFCEDEEK